MKTKVKLAILSVSLLLAFSVLVSCEKSKPQNSINNTVNTSENSDTEKSSDNETETSTEDSYENIMLNFDPVKDAYWAKENVAENLHNHKTLKPGQVFINFGVDEVFKNLPEDQYIALKIFAYKVSEYNNEYSGNEISTNHIQKRIFVKQLMKLGVIRDINHSDIYYATPSMIEQITSPEGYYINIYLAPYVYESFTYSADDKKNEPASNAKETIIHNHSVRSSILRRLTKRKEKHLQSLS